MTQRPARVPKFGNWDPNDHVPYTAVFDNARARKAGTMVNPNDPAGSEDSLSEGSDLDNTERQNLNETTSKPIHPNQRRASREGSEFGLPHAHRGQHPSRGGEESDQYAESSSVDVAGRQSAALKNMPENAQRQGTSGGGNQENGTSEHTGGDILHGISRLGVPPVHTQAYPGGRLGKKLGSASPVADRRPEAGTSAPGTPTRNRPDRAAAPLPKFGDWDVNNPGAGEGYTMIFNKARDEKKTGGTLRIPTMQTASPLKPQADLHKTQNSTQETSKWLCGCFYPNAFK